MSKSRYQGSGSDQFPDRGPALFMFLGMANGPQSAGGADRDRTGDPLLAKQVLSQLSYGPKLMGQTGGPGKI